MLGAGAICIITQTLFRSALSLSLHTNLLTIMADPTILNSKRAVYLGGLPDDITVPVIKAFMIPFGPIHSIDMPMDYVKGTTKGFAFVEYEDADDASEAIFNLDGAILMGRTVQVSMAQANQINKLSATEPVWNSDEWFQKMQQQQDPTTTSTEEEAVLKGTTNK